MMTCGHSVSALSTKAAACRNGRACLLEKVRLEIQRKVVMDDVAGDHPVAGVAQRASDCPASGGRLPDPVRQRLDCEERVDSNRRRRIAVVPPIGQGMPSALARAI
jgi:hypothetical protein